MNWVDKGFFTTQAMRNAADAGGFWPGKLSR
jgi:hypothetical protein